MTKSVSYKMARERFDQAAASWDAQTPRVILAKKIGAAIMALPLTAEMEAMEYGCGTGLVGLALAPVLRHLTAIDTSQGMLDVLRHKIADQRIGNVEVLSCNLETEAYHQRHDLIFSAMTLHHIKDTKGLLHQLTTSLKPGGYLAIADLVSEDGTFHKPDITGIWHHGFEPQLLEELLLGLDMEDLSSTIVHTLIKEEDPHHEYPVFLLTGRKPG